MPTNVTLPGRPMEIPLLTGAINPARMNYGWPNQAKMMLQKKLQTMATVSDINYSGAPIVKK